MDGSTLAEAELRAAVGAAENWGAYVTVRAYTPVSIRRAIAAGVKVIEHAHPMDEPTAKLIAGNGIWLSTRAFPDNIVDVCPRGSLERLKAQAILVGLDRTFPLAKKYRIKVAFGTDILVCAEQAKDQGALLVMTTRRYSRAEALATAKGLGAQLLALSGERKPHPGRLGVVEEGTLADLLLVDGDPIENTKLVAEPAKSFAVLIKDGRICKNTPPKGPGEMTPNPSMRRAPSTGLRPHSRPGDLWR